MFWWFFLFCSALLNFLDLSDKTFWCLCLVYLTQLAKTLQGCLIKNNSCSFWAEGFGLWNSLSGWRALGCQEQSSSIQSEPAPFPSGFPLFCFTSKIGGSASASLPVLKGYWLCIKERSDVDLSSYSPWQF